MFNKYLLITLFLISTFNTNLFAQACNTTWDAGAVYTGGETSSYNGRNYTAQWLTQGNQPNLGGAWFDNGTCVSTITCPKAIITPQTSLSYCEGSAGVILVAQDAGQNATYEWFKNNIS
jgi:chitodextrinase